MRKIIYLRKKDERKVQLKTENKTFLFKSPFFKFRLNHENTIKKFKTSDRNSVTKKSTTNFIEKNKSLCKKINKNSIEQNSRKNSMIIASQTNIRLKPVEKITRKNYGNNITEFFSFKFAKNLKKFFSSIFKRIFYKLKYHQLKHKQRISKTWKDNNNNSKMDSNYFNTNQHKKISLKKLKYSNQYQSSVINFLEVEALKFENIEEKKISKIKIFESSILDFEQVTISEFQFIENFLRKKLSTIEIKNSPSFSLTSNSTKSSKSYHSFEIKTSYSYKTKNESLNSSEEFLNSTTKFESNLDNLYQAHQNIINKYINSNLNEDNGEKSSKTFLIVPSLYQKYGFNLIKLFKNQVGKF